MRVTVDIDEDLLASARMYTGLTDISAVIHEVLRSFVAGEAARRLALLGDTQPQMLKIYRRRSALRKN